MALGENVADNPQAVLDVIECDEAVIEHQHRIVKTDLVAQAFG